MSDSGTHILSGRSAWTPARIRTLIPSLAGLAIAVVLSALLGAIILFGGESPVGAIGFVCLLAVIFLSFYRREWGLYIFLGTVLLIAQFEVPEFISDLQINISTTSTRSRTCRIEDAAFSPMDLHLGLLIVVWLTGRILKTSSSSQRPLGWPFALAFVTWLAIGFVSGAGRGGDATAALWELRGLGYLFIAYLFFSTTIRTPDQVKAIMWVAIIAITFKAVEGTFRFASLGFTLGGHDAMLTHEDPIFFITLWVLLMAFSAQAVRGAQRTALWWVLPAAARLMREPTAACVAGGVADNIRRALPWTQLVRILKRSILSCFPGRLCSSVLGAEPSRLLNQIRSGFVDDYATLGDRNYYSNLYRKLENYNLAYTVRQYPLEGIGFGTKYYQPLELIKINYALRDYMAHNNILWLLVKVGGIGFLLFWTFINVFGARGSMIITQLQNPYLKAVGIMIVIAAINQLVAAYFDLHLVRYRTMTYMGALMGLLPALATALKAEQTGAAQGSPATDSPSGEASR
jgi:hypothetical protein